MPALDDKTDIELLLEYSSGKSQAAFEVLVQRHGPMVHGVARRVLSNHHDAQDVTQATFLVLAREASKLKKGSSLSGWLHTVARRLSLDAFKSRRLREARENAAMKEKTPTDVPSAELQAEFSRELDAALSRLPERYRQPLVLFHLQGASIEEAAQRLNLHSGTFRTRLSRARVLLRDALKRRGVQTASVSMLVGMLATESKAAALGASGACTISQTILGKSSLPASAQSLADGLGRIHGLSGGSLLNSTLFIMKTKAYIIAATIIAISAVFVSAKLVMQKQEAEQPKSTEQRLAQHRFSSPRSRNMPVKTGAFLEKIKSDKDFNHLLDTVFLIADEGQRLRAIHQRLGMDVSDQVYRHALEECRYTRNTRKTFFVLCQKWAEADGEAAIQWAQQFSEEMRQNMTASVFCLWLAHDEGAALTWGLANRGQEQLEEDHMITEYNKPFTIPADQIVKYLEILHADESLPKQEREKIPRADFDNVISELGHRNPEATFGFMKSSGFIDGQQYSRQIQGFFEGWAGRDPDVALAAASEYLEGELRKNAMVKALQCWQMKYPDRSLREVVNLDEFSEEQHQELELSAVAAQARLDPVGALDRAMRAESPKMVEKMLYSVMEVGACLGESDIRDWVVALPEVRQKDMSFRLLAKVMSHYDLEGSVEMVSEISNSSDKSKAVSEVFRDSRFYLAPGDMEAGLRLADQSAVVPVRTMSNFPSLANVDEIDAFINWLRERRAEGRIEDNAVDEMEDIIARLEARREALD